MKNRKHIGPALAATVLLVLYSLWAVMENIRDGCDPFHTAYWPMLLDNLIPGAVFLYAYIRLRAPSELTELLYAARRTARAACLAIIGAAVLIGLYNPAYRNALLFISAPSAFFTWLLCAVWPPLLKYRRHRRAVRRNRRRGKANAGQAYEISVWPKL